MKKKVLHAGCGQKTQAQMPPPFNNLDQWEEVRLDVDPKTNPHIQADILDMQPVESQSMDGLFSSHNVEHVYIYQVPQVLSEFHRVLKPEGMVVITLPDLQAIAFHIARGNLETSLYESASGPITAIDILYGHTGSLIQGHHYMAHKCGFTAGTLAQHLFHAGFSDIVVDRDKDMNLWARGVKRAKDHPNYTDKLRIRGNYRSQVVDGGVPAHTTGVVDELDQPPVLWKRVTG